MLLLTALACTSTNSSEIAGFDDLMPDWSLQSDMPVDGSLARDGEVGFYHLKAGYASQAVNGMLEGVLMPLEGLRELEPEWEDEENNIVRYGPDQRPGESVERQLLIEWPEDDSRIWTVQEDAGEGWVTVFEGIVDAGSTDQDSSGEVTAWFDLMVAEDNPGPPSGAFFADYADGHTEVEVYSDFDGVQIGPDLLTSKIHFQTLGGNGGNVDFEFSDEDVSPGPGLEVAIGHGRWMPDGAGRADVRVIDGDQGEGTLSECWGKLFEVVYATNSWGEPVDVGLETDCPPDFQEAQVPPAP